LAGIEVADRNAEMNDTHGLNHGSSKIALQDRRPATILS